jgi:HSP20 family protein
VHFEPVGADRTRVTVKLAYDPQGIAENIGDALGIVSRGIDRTLKDFKAFIERRGRESGAWRGEVHQGRAERGAASGAQDAATPDEGFRDEARAGAGTGRSRSGETARFDVFPRGRAGRGPLEVLDEPFGLIRRMWTDMDRAFGRGDWPFRFGGSSNEPALWSPHVEVTQRGDELLVTADLPGVKREDVTLEIDDNALILQGERRSERRSEEQGMYRSECEYGSFYRAIPLPESAEPSSAQASMENGVLKVTLRAPPARRQGHRVTIQGN